MVLHGMARGSSLPLLASAWSCIGEDGRRLTPWGAMALRSHSEIPVVTTILQTSRRFSMGPNDVELVRAYTGELGKQVADITRDSRYFGLGLRSKNATRWLHGEREPSAIGQPKTPPVHPSANRRPSST